MAGLTREVRPVYVLIDSSGSTVRGGFAAACAQALPLLVDAAGRRPGTGVSVLAYGTAARVLVRLSEPGNVRLIPAITPGGLSSLAAGLRSLAQSWLEDSSQLAADGIGCLPPVGFVVADGLPTDRAEDLLAARDALDDVPADLAPRLHAAMPAGVDPLPIAGLRMIFHPLLAGTPAKLADSLLAAFGEALG